MSKKPTKISELIHDNRNYNKGNQHGNALIEKSLRKFGGGRSILLDKNNRIIAGNKTIENAGAIGLEDVIVVETTGNKIVAVKRTDIDLDSKLGREMALADNASAKANIEWDTDNLNADWTTEEQKDWGIVPEFAVAEAEEDDYEMPDEIKTDIVLGDLFEIGEHRLLCGDSTDSEQVAKLMGGGYYHTLITSPPYNQGNGSGDLLTNGKKEVRLYQDKNQDNRTKDEYYNFLIDILKTAFIYRNDPDHVVCWNVAYNAKSRSDYGTILFGIDNPFEVKETIVWDKGHAINLPQVGIYSRRCEFVFVMSSNDDYHTSQTYNDCRWNYWNISSNNSQTTGGQTEHRAAYPVGFAEKCINDFSLEGDNIYDPFLGSGTTMVACHQLNRKCYGMELDEKYCEVIVQRMIKLDKTLTIKRNGVDETSKWLEKMQ